MSRYVTVRVTQEDIDKAKRGDPYSCPLARVARRDLGYRRPWVGYAIPRASKWRLVLEDEGRPKATVPLSRRAQSWVERYDLRKPVQPATFRLPLP